MSSPSMPPYRIAAVTGASGGIGLAIVDELVRMGIQVHGLALPDEALDRLSARPGVTAHGVDVCDTAALRTVLEPLVCDVLVSNAGVIGKLAPVPQMSAAAIDELLDVNLRASLHAVHAVVGGMVERGRGHIVLTGSIAATRPTANTAVYSATKAALHAFADGLRLDLHGSGVRITVIAPGRVQSRLYDRQFGGAHEADAAMYSNVDAIQPNELATLVATALMLPPHIDVTRLEVVPTMQVYGGAMTGR